MPPPHVPPAPPPVPAPLAPLEFALTAHTLSHPDSAVLLGIGVAVGFAVPLLLACGLCALRRTSCWARARRRWHGRRKSTPRFRRSSVETVTAPAVVEVVVELPPTELTPPDEEKDDDERSTTDVSDGGGTSASERTPPQLATPLAESPPEMPPPTGVVRRLADEL